jgi:hypothetical protein
MSDKTPSLSELLKAADEVENLKSAIELTWRPEVAALRARIKVLESRLDQILVLANLE